MKKITAVAGLLLSAAIVSAQNSSQVEKDSTKVRKIDEIVLVGYGTQKKVNLTGSVAPLDITKVQNRVQPSLVSALQGTTPGVTVISRSGQDAFINVRGRGNLGASSPLYVIDGAISSASVFNNLDPNTVEAVSILKDAAASAIYGSRAAYGVILVKTKNGKKGKMQVSYNGYYGTQTPTYLPDVVNSAQYAELLNEGRYNSNPAKGKFQTYTAEQIEKFRNGSDPDYYPNTNWFDIALSDAIPTMNHSLSVSGGSDKTTYYTSAGFNQNEAFTPGVVRRRYNLSTNINSEVRDWLTLKGNVSYIRNEGRVKNGLPGLADFLIVPPTMVAVQSNGDWGTISGGTKASQYMLNANPLRAYSKKNWSNTLTENTIYNFGFDIKPFSGFVINTQAVMNKSDSKSKYYTGLQNDLTLFGTNENISGTGVYANSMAMYWGSSTRMQYITTAEYHKKFDLHDFKILAGTSYENYKYETLNATRRNFPTDSQTDLNAGQGSGEGYTNSGGTDRENLLSYFGRLNYVLADKYLFEANIRADASSKFDKSNRWGYFPSFSAGWKVKQENFMQDIAWISDMKLRASWGQLGNTNNVGYYDYMQTYGTELPYSWNDIPASGTYESRAANKTLHWETLTMTDIGLDASFFNRKLDFSIDFYDKRTNDILLPYNTPIEVGLATNPSQNIGKVSNKGIEAMIAHHNRIGDFKIDISANAAYNKNKILDLATSDNMISDGGDKIRYIKKVGGSVGDFYGYKTNGLYTQEEIDAKQYYVFGRIPKAGDIKYVPLRPNVKFGDQITADDRTVIGNDVPKFTYGVNLNLEYKNLFLSVFGQGIEGASVAFESEQMWALFQNSTPRQYHLNRWTVENPNPNAIYPRIYAGSLDNYNQNFSDWQVFDADYFRIKTITLGYNLPKSLLDGVSLSAGKLFLTGENLFTIRADKKMKDFDPEAPTGRGLGALSIKSIALGLNLNF